MLLERMSQNSKSALHDSTVHAVCSMGLEVTERSCTSSACTYILDLADIGRVQNLPLCPSVLLSPLQLGLGLYN